MQVKLHTLPEQSAVALAGAGQTVPHTPQFVTEELRSTSQPSPTAPLQLPKPALHAKPHVPALQVDVAFGRLGHAIAHEPQWFTSVLRLKQEPEQ